MASTSKATVAPAPKPPPFTAHVRSNNSSLFYVKACSACLAGSLSGTLALPSIQGFALYFLSSLLTSALFVTLKMTNKRAKFFANGTWDVVTTGLGENLLAFVLFWTFFYSVVHGKIPSHIP
ncbi:hypothetical protein OIO90_004322 [Microbotryomycetes sp. JL221]|nr:hypothetical protein OIO90_004322 [Microbotryomycetes sp. JL221]